MAKLTRKILGNVNGAVGDITFADWKGRTVIKAKSEGSKSDPTAAQRLVREKFKVLTGLSNSFSQVIPLGLSSDDITAYNLFRSLNYPAVDGTLGALSVDHSKIHVSRGKLPMLNGLGLTSTGQDLSVIWTFGNYGEGTDAITVIAYCPDLNQTSVNTGSIRSGGNAFLTVSSAWVGHEAHVYIYSGDAHFRSSSQYLGSVTIS